MITTPSSVLTNNGVLAVIVTATLDPDIVRPEVIGVAGDEKAVELGAWALTGFDVTNETSARYVSGRSGDAGTKTVLLERGPNGSVALVLVSGHPVVKSAKRMARRLHRDILLPGATPRRGDESASAANVHLADPLESEKPDVDVTA
jgi:hypothetical protein